MSRFDVDFKKISLKRSFIVGLSIQALTSCGMDKESNHASFLHDDTTRVNDIYYWEYQKELGKKDQAAVAIDSLIKNTGNGINRKTTAEFALDLHLFNYRIARPSENNDGAGLVDIGAHLNEGRLSSYSYVRILGDTKYKWETRTPNFNQEFTRVYDVGIKVPIATAAGAQMNVDTKVSGSIGAKLTMSSPDEYELQGNFTPITKLSALAGVSANGPFWSKASINGTYTLVNYQFNGAINVAYNPDSKKLSSAIKVDKHDISALEGDLSVAASFGPDAKEASLIKDLWTIVTKTESGPRYEKNLLHLNGLNRELDTFERTRSFYISEPKTFEECVIRAETLVSEAREMVEAVQRSANEALGNEASASLEDVFTLIDECKAMLDR